MNGLQQQLVEEFKRVFFGKDNNADINAQISTVDAAVFYRALLGRSPSAQELADLAHGLQGVTRREFLRSLLSSDEYSHAIPLLPAGQTWMADLGTFRFWFDTTDVEMGARMAMGKYEADVVKLLSKHVRPGMVALDIGAQTGYLTIHMAHLVGSSGRVLAFEPRPRSFDLLCRNVSENSLERIVRCWKVAVSGTDGHLSMQDVSGMFVATANASGASRTECIRIDSIPATQEASFVKIDVEGHEPSVLDGMSALISKNRPTLLIELNEYWLRKNSGVSSFDLAGRLEQLGYSLFRAHDEQPTRAAEIRLDVSQSIEVLAMPMV